jgi:putative membrane protein
MTNPTLKTLLLTWDWRPEVIVVLLSLGAIYGLGWWRLHRMGHRRLANGWRLVAYWGGLAVVGLALLSPVDLLQSLLFSVHMLQHELLMMVAPPLLWLGNPLPFMLWGLPAAARRQASRLLTRQAIFRSGLRRLSAPSVAWLLYVANFWLWHTPTAYDAALNNELIHDVEHLSFFLTALLFWWHVTNAVPRIHGSLGYGLRVAYVLAALAQNEVLGVSIAFARQPLYPYYTTVPRLWDLSVLDDQMLGGAVMWVPGGMMYVLTVLILLLRLLDREEKETSRQVSAELSSLERGVS